MTDLDRIRDEIGLAQDDPQVLERLARELHHLRHAHRIARKYRRRMHAVVQHALETPPQPVELDPPEAPGTSRDLLRAA